MKVVTFGCRINAYESALIKGWELPNTIVVNTCAVTAEAERQCRQMIRKLRRENPHTKIIVTGCAAQLNPDIYMNMPEVDKVIGNLEKTKKENYLSPKRCCVGSVQGKAFDIPIVTDFEGSTRAYLQIQQGCDHHCTFCIVNLVRGKNKGLPPQTVIQAAQDLVKKGYPELVITGIDVTSYPFGFSDLVERLLREVKGLKRLRLGSLDPAGIDDKLIYLFKSDKRLMPHMHLSLQSGADAVLKKMGRRHTQATVLELVQKLRAARPDIVFGADIITGFPTETDEMFLQTMDFIKATNIFLLHVFPFSQRPQTPSAKLKNVPVAIRKERAKKLRDLGNRLLVNYLKKQIGQKDEVLIEQLGKGLNMHYIKTIIDSDKPVGSVVSVTNKDIQNGNFVATA